MEVPIGTIMAFAGPAYYPGQRIKGLDRKILETGIRNVKGLADTGWLPCTGWYLRKDNPQFKELYNVLLYFWGESGDLFAIPDLSGLFLRGVSNNTGRDPDVENRTAISSGGATGNMPGSFQPATVFSYNAAEGSPYNPVHAACKTSATGLAKLHNHSGIENRPVNAYVNYIIKASASPINLKDVFKAGKSKK